METWTELKRICQFLVSWLQWRAFFLRTKTIACKCRVPRKSPIAVIATSPLWVTKLFQVWVNIYEHASLPVLYRLSLITTLLPWQQTNRKLTRDGQFVTLTEIAVLVGGCNWARSGDSSVGIATGYVLVAGIRFPAGVQILLFFTPSRATIEPTQTPI
jgi:hypothetical protein